MRSEHLDAGGIRRAFTTLTLICAACGPPVAAQSVEPDDSGLLNYAFAHELGSGLYEMSGRTVQIYRLPFYAPVRNAETHWPGLRVTLPVCVGFFDLKASDVEESGRSDDFASASFVPGVALEFPVYPIWTLEPFVELGVAMDLREDRHAWVYTAGLKSVVEPPAGDFGLRVGNRLVYVGAHTPGSEYDEDFATLETGVELRRAVPLHVARHALDGGVYAMNYLYLEPTELIVNDEPLEVGVQWELGLTLGTRTPVDLWRFKVPRLGIGYRFGDGVSAVRIVIGSAF